MIRHADRPQRLRLANAFRLLLISAGFPIRNFHESLPGRFLKLGSFRMQDQLKRLPFSIQILLQLRKRLPQTSGFRDFTFLFFWEFLFKINSYNSFIPFFNPDHSQRRPAVKTSAHMVPPSFLNDFLPQRFQIK